MTKVVRECLIKNIVFVTGLTRSGKTLLAPIVASMKNVDHIAINYLMEQVPMMHILKLIPDQSAEGLMRYAADSMFYDLAIGRNLNLRFNDLSAIWKSVNPSKYIKRLYAEEGDVAVEKIKTSQSIYLQMVHDALWHADLYFSSFPEAKMIHITRHPVDMVHNWIGKGYGGDFWENTRNATLTIEWEERILPYYAVGWEKEYVDLSEADRAIRMINHLNMKHDEKYEQLSEDLKNQVRIIAFEYLATQPDRVLDELAGFMDTETTDNTVAVYSRERCPRKLYKEDTERKMEKIKAQVSSEGFNLLKEMSEQYNQRHQMDSMFIAKTV